jgi:hypothetical protein
LLTFSDKKIWRGGVVFLQGVLRFHRVFGWLNRGGSWWIVVDWWHKRGGWRTPFSTAKVCHFFGNYFLRLSNFPAADLSAGIEAAFRVLLDRGNGRLREA